MRILVDDSAAFNQGAGIGRYARNVLPAAARELAGGDFRLIYAPDSPGPAPFHDAVVLAFPDSVAVTVRRLPFGRRRADQLWFRARLPVRAQLFTGPVDIAYSPDFTLPPTGKVPRAVTVHDLAFEVCPWVTPTALRRYLSEVVPRQVQCATRVVTVSQATKHDLMERYNVDHDRIDLVPNGVDDRFFAAPPLTDKVREELNLPRDYLLTVGTIEPRKNHRNLFAALDQIDGGIDLPLVVAGRSGWEEGPILEAARPLVERGRVVLLDYVPDEMLPSIYASAAAFVYPSWYEGFGLPVVESLAAGVPVVAGNTPALRETGGDVTLYADPGEPEEIAARIRDALASGQRIRGAQEARRGWARRFTWQAAGKRLADVFRTMRWTSS